MIDNDFHGDDEDGREILEALTRASSGVSEQDVPSAAFLRQVREAIGYQYMGGQYPADMPESVAKYLEPDGGLLATLDLAIALAEERELAEADASVVERVAMTLAKQHSAHADGDWNDPHPPGWADGEARRQAYREYALEILRVATPGMLEVFGQRFGQLPQFRDIVTRLDG